MDPEIIELDDINLSESNGLDLQAAQTWIYPTNYPTREYQQNIIEQALLKNTLVSLPTGLGKTFIAAVVMYNFFRWYPSGKIIFMAPTRPLVKQQVDACYDIMAIPQNVTAELTGSKVSSSRADIWMEKRVFFITPQVLQNDLETIAALGPKIKCVVFDEAHKARGNYAYCEVIRRLMPNNKLFRVLALSATPGSTVNDVQEVIHNLLISHLEFRTEESLDVHPYVFKRSLETVVVPLSDKLQEVRQNYIQILETYTRILIQYKVFTGNCSNLTKGRIFMTMKEYQQKSKGQHSNYKEIMKNLNICVTLYHAFDLLIRHGLRSFLSFFEEHITKPLLRGNGRLIHLMEDVRTFLGPIPNIEQLPDGSYPEIPHSIKYGHPKYYKLRDILISHFTQSSDFSRVIVFFEYRESVIEAFALLLQARPLIRPKIFIGQSAGNTQRIQISVVKAFREGVCNTLLSTCIGEEGLDVGDVDLIVCFDISTKSPIRMVQRMGRTGRKKEGSIIVMVTEGKEQQTLKDCLMHKNLVAHHVLTSKELGKAMYEQSPRLIPENIVPRCEKIFITVKKAVVAKKNTLKDMFRTISSSSSEPVFSQDLQIRETTEKIPITQMLWNKENPLDFDLNFTKTAYTKNIEKQRSFQTIHTINHSKNSKILVNLLQLADSKRFNIPTSQMPISLSQMTQNKNLKQGDIRNMLLRPAAKICLPPVALSQEPKSPEITKKIIEIENKTELTAIFSNELFTEISNFVTIQMSLDKKCKHCPEKFNCTSYNLPNDPVDLKHWIQPDLSILDNITIQNLIIFTDSLNPKSKKCLSEIELNFDKSLNDDFDDVFENSKIDAILGCMQLTQIEQEANMNNLNKNETFFSGDNCANVENVSFAFEPPKTLKNILNTYSITSGEDNPKKIKTNSSKSENFNRTVTPDLFDGSPIINTSCGQDSRKTIQKFDSATSSQNIENLLQFFLLKSLEDLFTSNNQNKDYDSDQTIIYSPDDQDSPILSNRYQRLQNSLNRTSQPKFNKDSSDDNEDGSPIICSSGRIQKIKKKISFDQTAKKSPAKATPKKPNLKALWSVRDIDTPSKFLMNDTKLCSTPKITKSSKNMKKVDLDLTAVENKTTPKKYSSLILEDINDFCDLSVFGITDSQNKNKTPSKNLKIQQDDVGVVKEKLCDRGKPLDNDDICEMTFFGESSFKKTSKEKGNMKINISGNKTNEISPKRITEQLSIDDIFDLSTLEENTVIKTNAKGLNKKENEQLSIGDICDLSIFGENIPMELEKNLNDKNCKNKVLTTFGPKETTREREQLNIDDICDLSIFGENISEKIKEHCKESDKNKRSKTNKTGQDKTLTEQLSIDNISPISNKKSVTANTKSTASSKRFLNFNLGKVASASNSPLKKIGSTDLNKTMDKPFDISDLCDLSEFGIVSSPIRPDSLVKDKEKKLTKVASEENFVIPKKSTISSELCKKSELSTKNNPSTFNATIQLESSNLLSNYENKSNKLLDFMDLTSDNDDSPIKNKPLNKSYSQLSITQMISLVDKVSNKTEHKTQNEQNNSSQKENVNSSILNDLENFEEFNVSFKITPEKSIKPPTKKRRLSLKKNSPSGATKKVNIAPKKIITKNDFHESIGNISDFLNTTINSNTSEDEFEEKIKSPVWIKPKETKLFIKNKNTKVTQQTKQENIFSKPSTSKLINRKALKANDFIEGEAELSEDENVFVSDDEEDVDLDCYDASFVSDETQAQDTQMHAKYLESIRSPMNNRGKFKIPERPRNNISNVFSQVVNYEDDTYGDDSFVVNTTQEAYLTKDQDLSELEILEMKLKEMKRKKKRKKSDEIGKTNKRRRIIEVLSDDSD